MIHGNGSELKTKLGTFQTKYHKNGGKIGSYSVVIPKKVHVPQITAQELIFAVLRVNREISNQVIFTYCALSYRELKKAKQYIV